MNREEFEYCIESFGFLLKPNKVTPIKHFAQRIKEVYDTETPRTKQAFVFLSGIRGDITREHTGGYRVRFGH